MDITVGEILNMEPFKEAKLIAGDNGLNRTIKHINSMEIPDITPWISEGELLITTGYSIKNNVGLLESIIKKLYDSSAAGIAIKTKFIGPIDNNLIILANNLNIPLIVLPDDIPFVEITTPLIKLLAEKQKEIRLYNEKINSLFMKLELDSKGLDGICSLIHTLTNLPVAIIDTEYNLLSSKYFDLSKDLIISFINYYQKHNIFKFKNEVLKLINISNKEFLIRKVPLKSDICSLIIIDITNNNKEIPRAILDHAALTIALEISRNQAIQEYSLTLDNMFFIDIMSGNIKSENELILRSEALNWPKPPYVPLYFDIKEFSNFARNYNEIQLYDIKIDILNIIKKHLHSLSSRKKVFLKSDNFSCMVPCNDSYKLYSVIEDIIIETKKKYDIDLYCGIGYIIHDISYIKNNFDDAKIAMDISRKLNLKEKYVHIEEVQLELAVLKSNSSDYFEKFILKNLKDVYDFDKSNNLDLFNTLNIYIKNGCNATNSAKELFIHRNTMNYRLNILKDKLNINLNDPQVIIDLAISYKINNVLNIICL